MKYCRSQPRKCFALDLMFLRAMGFGLLWGLSACSSNPQVIDAEREKPLSAGEIRSVGLTKGHDEAQITNANTGGSVQSLPNFFNGDNPKSAKSAAALVTTSEYLPVVQYNPAGEPLDYPLSGNPHISGGRVVSEQNKQRFASAKRAMDSSDFKLAQSLLLEIIEQAPGLSRPWILLGQISLRQNSPVDAETKFRTALENNRNNVYAQVGLARALRMQGQFIAAQHSYAEALKLWPDFPEAHINLAVLYDLYLNKAEAAQQHMEAYQFLTQQSNPEVGKWFAEIRQRTGVSTSSLPIQVVEPVAVEPIDIEAQAASDAGGEIRQ